MKVIAARVRVIYARVLGTLFLRCGGGELCWWASAGFGVLASSRRLAWKPLTPQGEKACHDGCHSCNGSDDSWFLFLLQSGCCLLS